MLRFFSKFKMIFLLWECTIQYSIHPHYDVGFCQHSWATQFYWQIRIRTNQMPWDDPDSSWLEVISLDRICPRVYYSILLNMSTYFNIQSVHILDTKGWSQNRVKIFYLYNVKIVLLTPSLPSIFTGEFHPSTAMTGREQWICYFSILLYCLSSSPIVKVRDIALRQLSTIQNSGELRPLATLHYLK